MSTPLQVGTATSIPGQIVYGEFAAVTLPTGGTDSFPVIIAQGTAEGPTLWITGSIHGNEHSGLAVIHHLLGPGGRDFPLADLRGTVVMIPTLSPAGLRTAARIPYYNRSVDPNRTFPDSKHSHHNTTAVEGPVAALEHAYSRLFAHIEASADYLIDLHNALIGSLPFVLRDPIYYHNARDKAAARILQAQNDAMIAAFGMPSINEFPSAEYLKKNLHRSVSGAVLNRARRPAFTAELGGYLHVDLPVRDAATIGLRNVMRWAKLLPGAREPLPAIPRAPVTYSVRRILHPRAPQSGIVTHLVDAGDVVQQGMAVARLTDIHGRPLGPDDGLLRSEFDGYVVGRMQGIVYYENEPVLWLAVRDQNELLLPYPDDY